MYHVRGVYSRTSSIIAMKDPQTHTHPPSLAPVIVIIAQRLLLLLLLYCTAATRPHTPQAVRIGKGRGLLLKVYYRKILNVLSRINRILDSWLLSTQAPPQTRAHQYRPINSLVRCYCTRAPMQYYKSRPAS